MKVCLVEPPKFVSLTNFLSTVSMPPIGLAYIAAAIREKGHEICVVDAPGSAPRNYYLVKDNLRVRGLTQKDIIVTCSYRITCLIANNDIRISSRETCKSAGSKCSIILT